MIEKEANSRQKDMKVDEVVDLFCKMKPTLIDLFKLRQLQIEPTLPTPSANKTAPYETCFLQSTQNSHNNLAENIQIKKYKYWNLGKYRERERQVYLDLSHRLNIHDDHDHHHPININSRRINKTFR